MSNVYDPNANYDYTRDDASADIDAFEIAEVAVEQVADEIEAERSFREIPPGEWELVVSGFLAPPKLEDPRTVYVGGQRTTYQSHSIVVKLAKADDPGAQVTDYFLLPPSNPAELPAYYHGAKSPDGKGAGFMASKFFHFIERLGYPCAKGAPLPPEARKIGNWKGRKVVATVTAGTPYMDQTTGEEKPGRNQVQLFSYRPAGSPTAGTAAATAPAKAKSAESYGAPPKRPGASGAAQMATAGLDNI